MKSVNVIQNIHRAMSEMRKSERKVAEYVLAHSPGVIHMRIVDLASAVKVSEPTVVRFCRAIQCEGFQDFKLRLAQQQATEPSFGQFALSDGDTTSEFSNKVFDATINILKKVRDSIDPKMLEAAISALCQANRVEFYGFGASAAVAVDAQHKFFRLQMSTTAYSDPHIQAMSAMSLGAQDVVVAISQSGRTKALLDAITLVKEAGGIVIGLAPGDTPVAEACAIPIHINVEEESEQYTPVSSRIAHLVVIDTLAVGVSQAKGPYITKHLQQLNRGLQTLRVSQEK